MEEWQAVFLAEDDNDPLRRAELHFRAPNLDDAEIWAAEYGQIHFPGLKLDSIA